MRIVVATLAAAAVVALAVSADAAPSGKKKQGSATVKGKTLAQRSAPERGGNFGYDATPDHFPVGSNEWWRAMDREGRGGCCGTTN